MLTTTQKEVLTGVWEGPESVWRRKGRPEGLSDFAREHRAHLWQRTGRSLDYSKPSPEVCEKLLGEEYIWSDPQTEALAEGLDRDLPPIDPQLQAEMDRVLNEAKAGAGPSANKPVSAPMPPTPPPAPVRTAPTAPDRARQRLQVLGGIDRRVAEADWTAARRVKETALTDAERLCLQRVRAIITYGANRHYQAEEPRVEQSLQRCLMLEDRHKHEIRSGNALRRLTMSRTKTDPRQAFRSLLKDYRHIRRDACRMFGQWAKMVDRAARRARTLQ